MINEPLIIHKLEQYRLFWKVRHFIDRCLFKTSKSIYGIRETSYNEYAKISAFRGLIQVSNNQFFLAIISVIIIQYLNSFVAPWALKFGFCKPDSSAYTALLGAVASIGAIFIGLYYAAISTIGSAIYARIPNNIRDLLANERLGYAYMSTLAYMTFTCLIFLAIHMIGFPPAYLAVLFIILLSGIGIIAFVKLGQRAFYFFDPTKLTISLFADLTSYLRHAQPNAFRWLDPSFQDHAKRLAFRAVDALDTLCDIAKGEIHLNGQPYANVAEKVCFFLAMYQDAKRTIPTNSLWYSQKYVQRNWYKTDETYLHTATITCTQIPPETVPDKNWLDDRLIGIIKQCIIVNYNAERFDLVLRLLDALDFYLQKAVDNLFIMRAYDVLDDIVNAFLESLPPEQDFLKNTEKLERVAIFERVSNLCINILLKFVKYSEVQTRSHFEKKIASVNWKSKADLYRHGFLPHLLKQIETFHQQLSFERDCESKFVSPNWYLTELIVLAETRIYSECIDELIVKCVNKFTKWSEICNKKKRFWLSAALQSRELEYWNKVEHHFRMIEDTWNNLINEKHINGLLWPILDLNSLKATISMRQKALLGGISKQSNLLSLLHRPEDFPDYAGQFLHFTAHSVLRAICEPDESLLMATYKPFFYASITKFQELRPKIKPDYWRFESQFNVAAAPIIDLLDISGYAKLMSALYNKPSLWEEVNKTWNEYLSDKDTPKDGLKFFAACVNITDSGLGIAYRGITRTSWKQEIERILYELPRKTKYHKGMHIIPYEEVEHHDPLVRLFARERMGSFYDGIDVFIAEFIHKNEKYKDLEFGRRRERLIDDIEREKKHHEESTPLEQDEA
jgi:hypothetical protein